MAEFPMLPFWTDAYLGDTIHLSTIEHGAYFLLLISMWRTKAKRLPNDDKLLARYARLTPGQWQRIKPTIMAFFNDHGSEISQSRLTDEANAVRQHSKRQSDKAKARWLTQKDSGDAAAMPERCRSDATLPLTLPKEDSDSSLRSESCDPPPPDPPRDLVKAEPIDEAVAAYNQLADQVGLPVAKKITEARRSRLRARLKDCGGLSGWVEALRRVAASSHCTGGNDRGWRADLDFLLQEQSFVRLMEGRYDDRSPKGRNGSFEAQMAGLLKQAREYDDADAAMHEGARDLLRREDPIVSDGLPAAGEPDGAPGPNESRGVVELFAARR